MTDLIIPHGYDLSAASTQELRAELARGLTLTAEVLTRLGAIWLELERRGEDLSDLRTGLARALPLIASGVLSADAVVAFAGRPAILRAIEGLPLDRQRRLAEGEPIEVIDPTNPAQTISLPVRSVPAAAIRLAIADGEVRSPDAQRVAYRRRRKAKPVEEGYHYRPRYDAAAGTITVGRMVIQLSELLAELSAAAGPDNSLIDAKQEEFVHVKIRLTLRESKKLIAAARRANLPDWEILRKAARAFGVI